MSDASGYKFDFGNMVGEILDSAEIQMKLLRWYDEDSSDDVELYLNPSQIGLVIIHTDLDDGKGGYTARSLSARLPSGRDISTDNEDTINRFMELWEVV